MEMKYCALLLLALTVYYSAEADQTATLGSFNIEAGGRYVATGEVRYNVQYPATPSSSTPTSPTPASFGIDPTAKVATFLFYPHYQYQLANNFYYGDSSIPACFIVRNSTYDDYVFKYRQLINWNSGPLLQKSWGGLVKDPAFVGWYGSLQAQTNALNRLTTIAFAQTLAPGGFATKVFGVFDFDDSTTILPNRQLPVNYTTLPPACATPIDYASVFYPSSFDQRRDLPY